MPNYLANRAFVNTAEMLNFIVDDTDEDMLGPFILPTDNDDYKIVVWRRYSTKNIDNLISFPANGPGRWIVLAGSASSNSNNSNVTEMIQFASLAAFKAYATPSQEVLYCLSESGKAPLFFVWNPSSTQSISEPIVVKLDTITTGRMVVESASTIISSIQPTGVPPITGITYLWQENNAINTYDSVVTYTANTTEWVVISNRTKTGLTSPDLIVPPVVPTFDGDMFVNTVGSVVYIGLNGGWTIIAGVAS